MKYMGDDQMSLIQKDKIICQIRDFACAYDERVDTKELEKMEHYQHLAWELRKIWNTKLMFVPLMVGALGAAPINLRNYLKKIGIETQITEFQKTVLLHTAWILQEVFDI